MKQVDLAKKFSISQKTVSKVLLANEIETRRGEGGNKNKREFCKNGHKLADPNLYYIKNHKTGNTSRTCKTCALASNDNYYKTVRKYKITKAVR
jgi:hypothetical protein